MRPSTTAYNDDGTSRRTLSPSMRAVVLAVTARAGDVDAHCVYTDERWVRPHRRLRTAQRGATREREPPALTGQDTHNVYGMGTQAHLVTETLSLGRYRFLTGRASASLVLL